ncbi:MarR family winged helix-turn-helix transcriptional regulator [Leucobacter sp. M11]|uniref:MarR family winged helix-turn-helix transcriptional regulator n=1 Tax=Leucobacter sp. M11 TaxID=2993565 RepID=UPI002D80DC1A|nr:MarR family transcriptional regulator [Leucobacter sp. M11]MEB4614058.1 MarR family transcriptional regulator [Leucobacter sp. M11]
MTATPDPLALESQVCFALTVASRSIVAAYRPVLDPMGITHPQYLVMLALWQHGDLNLNALARLLHQESSTVSPIVKRLETLGLLSRDRASDDERKIEIRLTERGQAMKAEASRVPHEMADRLGLDHSELTELHRSMLRLVEATTRASAVAAQEHGEG